MCTGSTTGTKQEPPSCTGTQPFLARNCPRNPTGVSLIRPYSCNTRILPYPAVSCRILSYPAVSCRILPYPAVSCRILPYPAVSCRICRILPYPAVSCRILPYASNRNPNPNPNLNPNCNPNLEFQLLVKVS